ncbi:MAG: hypothetical protein ABIJ96_12995, partial [Elusimicrobiota bacterium]
LLKGLSDNRDADLDGDQMVGLVELGAFSKKTTARLSRDMGRSQTPVIIGFGTDIPLYRLKQP